MAHTRARSKSYPYVDREAFTYIIEKMGLPVLKPKDLEQLMIDSLPEKQLENPTQCSAKLLRPSFIEALVRVAMIKYKIKSPGKTYMAVKDLTKGPIALFRAKNFRCQNSPYHKQREESMWSSSVADELSINEENLRKVFALYESPNENKSKCIRLNSWLRFVEDLKMDISPVMARQCFAESKF